MALTSNTSTDQCLPFDLCSGGMTTEVAVSSDTDSDSGEFVPSEAIVSNEVTAAIRIVVDLGLCSIITNAGIVTNILMLTVFYKQGYTDSMNISMSTIGYWDLVKSLAGAIHRWYGPMQAVSPALGLTVYNFTFCLNYVHVFSGFTSSVLATYVAIERMLCVTFPFKVKSILSPKVTFIAMLSLSIFVFGCFVPIFCIFDYVYVYSDKYNATVGITKYNTFYKNHGKAVMLYYNVIGAIYPMLSFTVTCICTLIIIIQLRRASKFRANNPSAQSGGAQGGLSTRDRQVVKMLLAIIIIYIINLFPRIVQFISFMIVPDFYLYRYYHNFFYSTAYFIFIFDYCNSTINIFVFLTMSSNFKATFMVLFCGREAEKK